MGLQSQILARTNGEKPDDDAVSIADYDRVTYLESEIDSMIADLKALHSLPNGSSPRPDPAQSPSGAVGEQQTLQQTSQQISQQTSLAVTSGTVGEQKTLPRLAP